MLLIPFTLSHQNDARHLLSLSLIEHMCACVRVYECVYDSYSHEPQNRSGFLWFPVNYFWFAWYKFHFVCVSLCRPFFHNDNIVDTEMCVTWELITKQISVDEMFSFVVVHFRAKIIHALKLNEMVEILCFITYGKLWTKCVRNIGVGSWENSPGAVSRPTKNNTDPN